MTPTRKERTEEITRQRREQILHAALDVFSRKGFASATTAEIARVAGVSEGTVFKYFRSKRELFIACIKGFIMAGPFLGLIDRLLSADIADTLKLIMEDRFHLIESGLVSRIPLLMADVMRDPELKALWIEQFLHPFLDRMAQVYRTLAERGVYRDLEPDVAVRTIGGMIFGFLFFKVMEGEASTLKQLPAERVTGDFIEIMLHGVKKETTEREKRGGGAG